MNFYELRRDRMRNRVAGFRTTKEIKEWCKDNFYFVPVVIERRYDWLLRWRKGNQELAFAISKKLTAEGFEIVDVDGSTDNKKEFMKMRINKCGFVTEVDDFVHFCVENLKITEPTIKESNSHYYLVIRERNPNMRDLGRIVNSLSQYFEVIKSCLYYPEKNYPHPTGYKIKIVKPSMFKR